MASDAVGSELVSKVVGYKIAKGDFSNVSPNLPQKVVIIGQANTGITTDTDEFQFTDAYAVGLKFGFGSPLHQSARILRPANGSGIGGIPTSILAQEEPVGAVAKEFSITVTGTATTDYLLDIKINGRSSVDGRSYTVSVVTGDVNTVIAGKINDAINNAILVCPFTSTVAAGVVTAEARVAGEVSEDYNITVTPLSTTAVTYAIASTATGSGVPAVTASLSKIGNKWATIILNTYQFNATKEVANELMAFNGIPDPNTPTGRFSGTVMKPFVAVTGSVEDNDSAITDDMLNDVTINMAPAPLSKGSPAEAAANWTLLLARQLQDSPHLDISGQSYPDMPTPANIGTMDVYANRDIYVKKGNSTVKLVSGKYQVCDNVTTYHPLGETPPQFRYVRSLYGQDLNIKYGYSLLEEKYVENHAIAGDEDIVKVQKVVKPKIWKSILFNYADDLEKRAIITDSTFMTDSIVVGLSSTNPDRLETSFKYKRSGYARIAATTGTAGFNFGE